MQHAFAAMLFAFVAAAPGAAGAQGKIRAAVGADFRMVDQYWYFYPGGYSETTGGLPALSVEGFLMIPVSEKAWFAPGAALSFGAGSLDFSASGAGTSSESATVVHLAALGEAGFLAAPKLAILGRLGLAVTMFGTDAAGEGAVNLVLAGGVEIALTPRAGFGLLYELSLANLSAWNDAGVTSADPSLESYSTSAIQGRLFYRF